MTSKKAEDLHRDHLNKLLLQSGLECHRSPQESFESETLSGESEEKAFEEEESVLEEEPKVAEEEGTNETLNKIEEETPDIFPTPSLRKLLPDRIRKIEEQNRIHVLPKKFKTNIDPDMIPKIAYTAQKTYIDTLAEIVGCSNYKSSLAEFWFLDTMANLLRRAQEDELDRPTQAVLILWFCEWMKEIQHFDAADRQRMLKRFKQNMLAAAKFIAEEDHLPAPEDIGVTYEAIEENVSTVPVVNKESELEERKSHLKTVTFEESAFECSIMDLTKIIHYIYDLFSSDFQFDLVRSIFTFSPDYILIDSSYQLQNPKRMYTVLKAKSKADKTKKDPKALKNKNKKEVETVEFLALMERKEKEEREIEEQEERDREEYNKRSHILPLIFAETDNLFDKYWPPPAPDSEVELEPEVKLKGKKGKGK